MLASLIHISIRFRYIVVALAAGMMIIGIAVLPGMHSDVLPETAPTVVEIQTNAPGLSAPEVESLVTVPLEKNLLEGVMGSPMSHPTPSPGCPRSTCTSLPAPVCTKPASWFRSGSPRRSSCRLSPPRR